MSLNIKNEVTYRLVKELADETGVSMTALMPDDTIGARPD